MSNAARIESYLPPRMDSFEKERLAELEAVISAGLDSFLEVGRSLMEIRDSQLYRETHDTFESYCQQTWSISHRHGNRLIQSVKIAGNLGPMVPIPPTERQLRELAKADPGLWQCDGCTETFGVQVWHCSHCGVGHSPIDNDDCRNCGEDRPSRRRLIKSTRVVDGEAVRSAWQEAIDTAPDSGMSARHIAEVVRNRASSPAPILPDDLIGPVSEILGEKFEVYGTTEAVDMPWDSRFCIYTESGFAARQLLDRVGTEIRLRNIDVAVLIVPSETETAWFHTALDRIGSVVLFRGKRMAAFVVGCDPIHFDGLGTCLTVE